MSEVRLLLSKPEIFIHFLPSDQGKKSSNLRTKYELFPAKLWAKTWSPMGERFYPKLPLRSEDRKIFWESMFRLLINGKWYQEKAKYCFMSREEAFRLIIDKTIAIE